MHNFFFPLHVSFTNSSVFLCHIHLFHSFFNSIYSIYLSVFIIFISLIYQFHLFNLFICFSSYLFNSFTNSTYSIYLPVFLPYSFILFNYQFYLFNLFLCFFITFIYFIHLSICPLFVYFEGSLHTGVTSEPFLLRKKIINKLIA